MTKKKDKTKPHKDKKPSTKWISLEELRPFYEVNDQQLRGADIAFSAMTLLNISDIAKISSIKGTWLNEIVTRSVLNKDSRLFFPKSRYEILAKSCVSTAVIDVDVLESMYTIINRGFIYLNEIPFMENFLANYILNESFIILNYGIPSKHSKLRPLFETNLSSDTEIERLVSRSLIQLYDDMPCYPIYEMGRDATYLSLEETGDNTHHIAALTSKRICNYISSRILQKQLPLDFLLSLHDPVIDAARYSILDKKIFQSRFHDLLIEHYESASSKLRNYGRNGLLNFPPLFGITITRSKSIEQIVDAIEDLRQEYGSARELIKIYQSELYEETSPLRQLEIIYEFEDRWENVVAQVEKRKMRPTFLHKVWRSIKGLDPLGFIGETIDQLLEYYQTRKLVADFDFFINYWNSIELLKDEGFMALDGWIKDPKELFVQQRIEFQNYDKYLLDGLDQLSKHSFFKMSRRK